MVGVFAILKIQEGSNKEFESAARLMEEAVKKNEPGNNYYNFYKGQDDLAKSKLKFIGDPDKRICEDYLHI